MTACSSTTRSAAATTPSWERDLAKTARKPVPRPGSLEFNRSLERFTVAINRIAANSARTNAYQLRNELLLEMEKQRVRYQNGRTLDGYSAQRLFEDARRTGNHRRTLARNLDAQSGLPRPEHACAHHIVAGQDKRAKDSRDVIFKWGVGINDADNGVYLPRFKNVPVPSMPDAPIHGPIHTDRYHGAVALRLIFEEPQEAEACRGILRDIKEELIDGSFPWRDE